jgi:hypothetical protein
MKFLVDECLSPELVKLAHDRGHGESSHVVWRHLQGRRTSPIGGESHALGSRGAVVCYPVT